MTDNFVECWALAFHWLNRNKNVLCWHSLGFVVKVNYTFRALLIHLWEQWKQPSQILQRQILKTWPMWWLFVLKSNSQWNSQWDYEISAFFTCRPCLLLLASGFSLLYQTASGILSHLFPSTYQIMKSSSAVPTYVLSSWRMWNCNKHLENG